jgi:plastocyanin
VRAGKPHIRRARLAALLGAASLALLALPSGASADPTEGCTTPDVGTIREYTCYWKPPPVGGYAVEQDYEFSIPRPTGLPGGQDSHITHAEVDLVDQNFDPVPISRLMLHHIVFLNLARQDRTCEGKGFAGFGEEDTSGGTNYAPERWYAAGEERAKISFADGYGYPTRNNHNWSMVYMFMNHKPTTDNQAWVEYKLTIDTSGDLEPAIPYWLDVANCRADPIYNVPGMSPKAKKRALRRARKGGPPLRSSHTRSEDFTVQEDGWLVGGAGHVHGGAEKLTITKPSCNNLQVAQSVPTWGLPSHEFYNVKPVLHEPGPIGMSAFQTRQGIPVTAGQQIRLNSIYDGVRPHVRVMGIYIVYLAQDRPDDLPAATPQTCGGAPGDIAYGPGTNLTGRPGPVPYTIPLTGLNAQGNAVTINGPPGPIRRMKNGATVFVGDRYFGRPNVRLRRGSTLNYFFGTNELHNLTLANGPLGIGSPNLDKNRVFSQRFTRAGTYRLFCGLHPTQMSQRVIVKQPRKKHRRNRRNR